MKICILGKFPPIQGGVSKLVYDTSHNLAKHGNDVHVLTNANEVENGFKLILDKNDWGKLSKKYKMGSVSVHNLDPIDKPDFGHIPESYCYETRLFGKGIEIISVQKFDLIIGWFLQPYAFVASLLSEKFKIPLIIIHAGSDIGRLVSHPQLNLAYRAAFKNATYIVSQKKSCTWPLLQDLGVVDSQLLEISRGRVLPRYFSGTHAPSDLNFLISQGSKWLGLLAVPHELSLKLQISNNKLLKPDIPTIAIYGKVGYTKGTFDLIRVLSQLAEDGVKFNFCIIALGKPSKLSELFNLLLNNINLLENTFILSPIANWNIPKFIAACDITFFLERDFDLEFHTPQVPLEILASGSCLVCSGEVAKKLFFREFIRDEINHVQIEDPRDTRAFKCRLKKLLESPDEAKSIARRGKKTFEALSRVIGRESSIVSTIERGLKLIAAESASKISLQHILTYENDHVVSCFRRQYNLSLADAHDVFKETLKWLYLCADASHRETNYKPTFNIFGGLVIIDEMLHNFILCTRDYMEFCMQYLERFIHHEPISEMEIESVKSRSQNDLVSLEKELYTEKKAMMGYVYDVLGEETVLKWFGEYSTKYSHQMLAQLKVN